MSELLTKIVSQVRKLGRLGRDRSFDSLLPVAETFRVLERERARADRNHDEFSLIAFTVRNPRTDRGTFACLARILKRRLRLTDEAGWLSPTCIAAVLAHTPAHGAWTLVDDVCLSFPAHIALPACKIYHYPSDDIGGNGNGNGNGNGHHAPRHAGYLEPVHPLEPLFVRPLPTWKRALDILGAVGGLILLAPLLLLVAAVVKLSSHGPVFFRQQRTGRGGRPFILLKFRSMVVDAEQKKAKLLALNEQDGPAFKLSADPRVTLLGRFLRASSIDELPQLWNVLCGDMSLVGPRPLPCQEADACTSWQRRRLDVNPGLTCIWQVLGRSRVSFADWVRMDLQYIRSRSLGQDLKLILQTIPAMLLRRGL